MDICYLCGVTIDSDDRGDDHFPPKQFFARPIRKRRSPRLLTLPAHKECNKSFQHDEDYFVSSLVPLAVKSVAGEAVVREHARRFKKGKSVGLTAKVLGEFEKEPSGILLPDHLIAKRIEGERIRRISWKLTRGIHFLEVDEILPELTPNRMRLAGPGDLPPEHFSIINNASPKGEYPGVFAYKNIWDAEGRIGLVGMLIWDSLIFTHLYELTGD